MSNLFKMGLILILAGLISLLSCFSSGRNVYTERPARTIPLDSVTTDAGAYRLEPDPDSLMLDFNVPDTDGCRVIVDLLTSQHKVARKLIDSVYSAGWHKFFWPFKDPKGMPIEKYHAYYYKISICDSTYTKSFYYRPKVF